MYCTGTYILLLALYLESAYIEALKDGREPISYVRVMFLGEGEAGKSSMLDGLMKKKWSEKEEKKRKRTMLAETRDIKYQFMEGGKQGWSEMDKNATVAELACKAKAPLVKRKGPRVNRKAPPEAEEEFRQETETLNLGESEPSKEASDACKQCYKDAAIKAQKLEEHMSSRESHDVLHVWDCGGQPVFLNILSAFITARTMFLFLFDASKKEEGLKNTFLLMVQWMQLIYASLFCKLDQGSRCPRILPIGSRGDVIKKRKPEERERILKCLKDSYSGEAFRRIILSNPFPLIIDNTTAGPEGEDPGYGEIREAVHKFAEGLKVNTPHAWVLFRSVLKNTVEKKGENEKYMLPLNEVVAIAKTCNIPSKSVGGLLKFYHELGVFLHYAQINKLKDKVFINPHWLFQQLCKLLMPEKYELEQMTSDYTDNLSTYGILQLTEDVNDTISEECGLSAEQLITLLDHFNLAKKLEKRPKMLNHVNGDCYFIPCMLIEHTESTDQKATSHRATATLHISFEMGFVPPGFFVRLAAQMSTDLNPLFDRGMYRNRTTYKYKEYDIVTIFEPSSLRSIQVDFVENVTRKSPDAKHRFAESCLSFRNELYKMTLSVLEWLPNIKLFFGFPCTKEDKHFVDLKMKVVDGCVSSEKDQESPMSCESCGEPLEMEPEHKYWLPQVCFDIVHKFRFGMYHYKKPSTDTCT